MHKRPYLPNSNFEKKKESDLRKDNAVFIIDSITKSKSSWMQSEMLKNLYFYLDFDFVKQWLVDFYKKTTNKSIRTTIKGLYNGSLDLSELIEQAKLNEEHFQESDRIIEEYEREILSLGQDDKLNISNPSTMRVLKYTKN